MGATASTKCAQITAQHNHRNRDMRDDSETTLRGSP
jgi:hypothetical protein